MMKVEYEFVAIYNDGTELKQQYGTPDEKCFKDIDQERLVEFWLENEHGRQFGVDIGKQAILVGELIFFVEFPEQKDGKLVYFRRIRQDFKTTGTVETIRFCIGLQVNINGVNHQQYLFINPDGTFTLSQKR